MELLLIIILPLLGAILPPLAERLGAQCLRSLGAALREFPDDVTQ